MTALKKYARLEATGLWRAADGDQRREVVVSVGDATLIISDMRDQPITHWSLAALQRANPGKRPAVFHPDGDPGETLELDPSEAEMIAAIERLRRAVERARPRPGRLRGLGVVMSSLAVAALAFFWLPGALISHTVSVVPDVKRTEIGDALLERIERMTGPACADKAGVSALRKLRARLGTGPISLMPGTVITSLHLPGGRILLDRALVEDFEEPDVAAGFALAEQTLARGSDPLRDLLETTGTWSGFQLLTTGTLKGEILDRYAEELLTRERAMPDPDALLAAFSAVTVRSAPYALARDITGEDVLPLLEADPMAGRDPVALLSDADWLRLQNICGG
ncbi:hypothetical protein [Roseobacter ponti]|uniref:Uncharacterized protein n=1 Tax=Roseobacter ponti TaxID=1891787 RepID=A0A858STD6_9RHOB|nr:hypothetical protein [Roseobacter ponti]QJF52189.1 hypothetical protein G3256_13910 [Roseobacter ponti]